MKNVTAKERLNILDSTYLNLNDIKVLYQCGYVIAKRYRDKAFKMAIADNEPMYDSKKTIYVPTRTMLKIQPINRKGLEQQYRRELNEKN